MDALSNLLGAVVKQYLILPALLAFFGALFVYVMTRNYLRLRQEKLTPDFLEGEQPLDQIEIGWVLMKTKTVLTTRRIIQLRLNWFLSKRKILSLALADLHSVFWRRHANWVFLLAGLWLIWVRILHPLALLLILYGLQGKIYSIIFDTPFTQMLWTRVPVRSLHRAQLGEMVRFYRNSQAAWARVRAEKGLPAGPAPAGAVPDCETDLLWGRPVWVYVVLLLILGFLQRLHEPHLSFDDYFFAPIYLGLPLAVASRSVRDGLWAAILGFAALFTMKFPGGGLLAFAARLLISAAKLFTMKFPGSGLLGLLTGDGSGLLGLPTGDGRSPYFTQCLFVMLTLVLMVLIAATLARYLHPSLAFLAAPLWLGFVGLHMPAVFFDYGLYTKVALAMAAAILLAWVERSIGHLYGAAY